LIKLTFRIETMKTTIELMFFLSFFVSLLMGALSYFLSRGLASKEFVHLTEFWASLASMTIITYLFSMGNEELVALSMLGWVWPIKSIIKVAEDMSGMELFKRSKVIVLAIGAFVTLILAYNKLPFMIYSSPFCLGVGVVGALVMADVYKKMNWRDVSVLGHASFALLGLFFLVRFLYPFWRLTDLLPYGVAGHFIVEIGLAAATTAFYMEIMKGRHEKQLEYALKERSDKFLGQSKYSELGMMSAGVAHEINNALAIVQAKTTQLIRINRDPSRSKEVSEGLEMVLATSDRIKKTIQGLRDFVHQDERTADEEFTVKTLMDDVLAFCGQRMKNHGVSLRFYGKQNCALKGHKIQLEQVILNLLNNSFDAIEFLSDKWIEVTVRETDTTIQLQFKDSGAGIPPETACHLMEPFFSTKQPDKGTGLGLFLAHGIIEKHGGTLSYVESANHTTFLVELPKPNVFHAETFQREIDQGQATIQ